MDINAEKGAKVKFIEGGITKEQISWGSHDDPTNILEAGKEYTIDHTEIRSWHTKVFLDEFPGRQFNSVWFE